MKVLVYGAGVLGSLYAARLRQAGEDVTILARGQRFQDIEKSGIILEHVLNHRKETVPVQSVGHLDGRVSDRLYAQYECLAENPGRLGQPSGKCDLLG